MTVETQVNFVIYDGDDSAVNFPFTFPILDVAHLEVRERDTTTLVQTVVSTSNYNVTGTGNENGGAVVYDVAPATGIQVIIARLLPLTQDLDVLNQGGFYPESVEQEFDISEMQIQQLQEQLNRSVKGPMTEQWPLLPPPPDRRGHLLGFTDDENAYPTIDVADSLLGLLLDILQAGVGISITHVGDHIVITNTMPGDGSSSWLLEDSTAGVGGSGSSGDAEFVLDTVAAGLVGDGVTVTYDDAGNTITLTVTGSVDTEAVYDAIAAAITAGSGIVVTNDDAANTTTVSADPEFIRDTIGTALVGGPGITITVDDAGNFITVTNDPKILTIASNATITPTFAYDQVNVTALAVGTTIANPTGTAVDGHGFVIRIKDNGTARAIAFGTKYRAFNDALPTTTFVSKTMYIGCAYNAADDKVDVLCVRNQA
jgi:hypothetical protein